MPPPPRHVASPFTKSRRSAGRIALTVTAVFLVAGAAWILFTDVLLYEFARDPALVARLETAKGWTFVAFAALLIYAVTLWSAAHVTRAQAVTTAVVESIADGVLLLGADRTIVHVNPAAARILRTDSNDLIGMGSVEFSRRFRVSFPNGSLVPPHRYISQRVFDEGGPLNYKAILFPPGGTEVVISVTAAAVRDRLDEPPHLVVSVMHDVTKAEHLERLRDQFLAGAAHSLKTPVAIIKANAHVLSRDAPERCGKVAGAVQRQCDRIDRLVQNLLVLARVRSQTLQLFPAELELSNLVEKVAREMTAASRTNEVRTEVSAAPRVHADAERLAMALRNLVDEGFRSSPPGAPLTLLLRRRGADAEIGVRCQPLPPEERACAAYEEFGDASIGRCVATTIIEAHGGTLWEDREASETTAWIDLPAIQEERARA